MSRTLKKGRLCNQIIMNLAVSIIAEKHNLYVDYCAKNEIKNFGINLFIGENKYDNTIKLTDSNYFEILNTDKLLSNIDPNNDYFQTKEITNMLYNYLKNELIKQNIINANSFKTRYNNNNDIFIHIRLTDAERHNPGLEYYKKAIEKINYNNIYICSDNLNHNIVQNITKLFSNVKCLDLNPQYTIQFGSTCKNIILSHGSFSAFIGYLGYYSTIYYPEYEENKIWYGDMFSIDGWNIIKK
jgi:hypothetical protein